MYRVGEKQRGYKSNHKTANELELTKMLFVYENTVGGFESKDVLDLFTYYSEATNENGFEAWLEKIELQKEWIKYRSERGIDESYDR